MELLDWQDKYTIWPIYIISSQTGMSDVAYNTRYNVYWSKQKYYFGPMKCYSYKYDQMFSKRTKCPMKFNN